MLTALMRLSQVLYCDYHMGMDNKFCKPHCMCASQKENPSFFCDHHMGMDHGFVNTIACVHHRNKVQCSCIHCFFAGGGHFGAEPR